MALEPVASRFEGQGGETTRLYLLRVGAVLATPPPWFIPGPCSATAAR